MARKGKGMSGGYKGGSTGPSTPNQGGPKRPPLTHFLCIPLVTTESRPQLEKSLGEFQDILNAENEGAAVPIALKAIRPIGTIHFTLGVMSLISEEKFVETVEFLNSLDLIKMIKELQTSSEQDGALQKSSSKTGLLRVSLTSLHSMHDPTKTSILYAGPDEANADLYPLCSKLSTLFKEKGFVLPDDRPLKLHATILNTIYAKPGGRVGRMPPKQVPRSASPSRITEACTNDAEESKPDTSHGHGPNARGPVRLDATSLIDKCKNFVWAEDFVLEKLAICKMGAKKITDAEGVVVGEEYEEVASIAMPS